MKEDKATVRVRLGGIATPESKQLFGKQAKDALANMVQDNDVIILQTGTDKHQHVLGHVLFSR